MRSVSISSLLFEIQTKISRWAEQTQHLMSHTWHRNMGNNMWTHCDTEKCEDEGGKEDGDGVGVQQTAGSDCLLMLGGQVQSSGVHQQTPGTVRCTVKVKIKKWTRSKFTQQHSSSVLSRFCIWFPDSVGEVNKQLFHRSDNSTQTSNSTRSATTYLENFTANDLCKLYQYMF